MAHIVFVKVYVFFHAWGEGLWLWLLGLVKCETWNLTHDMWPDMEFVKKITQARFSGENFTPKSINYNKFPSATKQQKKWLYNKISTFGVSTLDNLIRVILLR